MPTTHLGFRTTLDLHVTGVELMRQNLRRADPAAGPSEIEALLATGQTAEEVLAAYPYIEREDIQAALAFAAWRSEEVDLPLKAS